MDVEKIAMVAGVGFALAIGAFVLWGPSPRPRRRGQIIGLTNLGYTCFMNAVLQSLAACPTFTEWLHARCGNNEKGRFAQSLLSVLDKINGFCEETIYGDVTPTEIINSLGPLWIFTPGHQDAHELFDVLLSALQAEMQPLNRKGCLSDALPISDARGSGDPFALRSVSCIDITRDENGLTSKEDEIMTASTKSIPKMFGINSAEGIKPGMIVARSSEVISMDEESYLGMEDSFRAWNSLCTIPAQNVPVLSKIAHPFSGLLTSQLKCTNCNWKSSVRYDKFESVSLPLPPAGGFLNWRQHTLTDLLSRFVTSEVIHDVQCDGCASRCPAVKTLTLGKLPRCLCIHIPRTTWGPSGSPIKRDDPIIFPEILVLDPFTFTEAKKRSSKGSTQSMVGLADRNLTHGRNRYRLQSVVEHRGPVDSGHFVSYRRGNRPGQWMYTSDITVERTTLSDVLYASPYLLFYERINDSQA